MSCLRFLTALRLTLGARLFRRSRFLSIILLCTLMFVCLFIAMQENLVGIDYQDVERTSTTTYRPEVRRSRRSVNENPTTLAVVLSGRTKSSSLLAAEKRTSIRMPTTTFRIHGARDELGPGRVVSRWTSYREALEARAENGTRRLVILALVDEGFIQMALNFYDVSLKPHGLDTWLLFVGLTNRTCHVLDRRHRLPCHVYEQTASGQRASRYRSSGFLEKMNIRTAMILNALKLGYTVLHTDVDMTYYDDPLKHIPCNGVCDLAALVDDQDLNAGFVFVRPTNNSMWIYSRMRELAAASPLLDDQDQLTQAVEELENDVGRRLAVIRLDRDRFQNGRRYFELSDRSFVGDEVVPCPRCVVVHNNWIVSVEAKVYRAKETHHWFYDGPDRYYTAPDRRYLLYSNPLRLEDPEETDELERQALVSALAICQLLNRTLILPKFHCFQKNARSRFCPLNSKFSVASFDGQFAGRYREHSFLEHPMVPERFRTDLGKVFLIPSNITQAYMPHVIDDVRVTVMTPRSPSRGASPSEILQWFVMMNDPVLRFHSLYGAFSTFDRVAVRNEFDARVSNGLKAAKYRQL